MFLLMLTGWSGKQWAGCQALDYLLVI